MTICEYLQTKMFCQSCPNTSHGCTAIKWIEVKWETTLHESILKY